MVHNSKVVVISWFVVIALVLYFVLRDTDIYAKVRDGILLDTLHTLHSQKAVEKFADNDMSDVQKLLSLAYAAAPAPVPMCHATPSDAVQGAENVKNIMISMFRKETGGLPSDTAFANLNASTFQTVMATLGLVSIQLEAIASKKPRTIVFFKEGSPVAIQVSNQILNDIFLTLLNTLVQYKAMGGTGEYMKRYIDANIGTLNDIYFKDAGTFLLEGKQVPINFMTIAESMRMRMDAPDSDPDPVQDILLAQAIQKNAGQPIPAAAIAPLTIIPMYTSSTTFVCSA